MEMLPLRVELRWDLAACPGGSQRRRKLESNSYVQLGDKGKAGVVVRCGYSFAPPPWPAVAVAPLSFFSEEEAKAEDDSLAQARFLLQQLRLVEARSIVGRLKDAALERPTRLAAAMIEAEINLLLGGLDSARAGLDELRPLLDKAQKKQVSSLARRVARAAAAWEEWQKSEDCQVLQDYLGLARADRMARTAMARCCLREKGAFPGLP
jgi:hypothetical protein